MSYLLDTNVVSEIRKVEQGTADDHVVAWARSVSATSMWLSVISVHELEVGVGLVERRDPTQGQLLRQWLDARLRPAFADRLLVVDDDVARASARCHIPDPRDIRDTLIAATASVHDLTVVTRNVNDFTGLPVRLINPWT